MQDLPSPVFGGRTELVFEDGYLVRREYELLWKHGLGKNVLSKTEYFVPTENQWRCFWEEMNRIRVWSWKEKYDPGDIGENVYDGGGWHLIVAYRGKAIDTKGGNAGPKPGHPKVTVIEGWEEEMKNALKTLLKEKG
jgi:hypothetical protein